MRSGRSCLLGSQKSQCAGGEGASGLPKCDLCPLNFAASEVPLTKGNWAGGLGQDAAPEGPWGDVVSKARLGRVILGCFFADITNHKLSSEGRTLGMGTPRNQYVFYLFFKMKP